MKYIILLLLLFICSCRKVPEKEITYNFQYNIWKGDFVEIDRFIRDIIDISTNKLLILLNFT